MNQDFNNDVISKSQYVLKNNNKIEEQLLKAAKKLQNKDSNPEIFGDNLLKFFYKQNRVRPEILLDGNSQLANKIFNSPEQHSAFCEVLEDYQRQEQVMIQACLDVNSDKIEGANLNRLGMALDPDFRDKMIWSGNKNGEYIKLKEAQPERFYSDFALTAITLEDFNRKNEIELLHDLFGKETASKEEQDFMNCFVVGEDIDEKPLVDIPEIDQEIENIEQKVKQHKEISQEEESILQKEQKEIQVQMKKNADLQNEFTSDFLKGYTTDKKQKLYYDDQGALAMKFERSFLSKEINRAIAPAGASSDKIAGMLTAVRVKHIQSIPDQDLPAFKEALESIQEKGLFDLDEITLAKGLNPEVKRILEEVKSNKWKIGDELEPEQPENERPEGEKPEELKQPENEHPEGEKPEEPKQPENQAPQEPKERKPEGDNTENGKPEEPKQPEGNKAESIEDQEAKLLNDLESDAKNQNDDSNKNKRNQSRKNKLK
ncbi:TPA: hypothetical protein ACN35C_004648 [Vibrio parahaemolyticus]